MFVGSICSDECGDCGLEPNQRTHVLPPAPLGSHRALKILKAGKGKQNWWGEEKTWARQAVS